MQRFFRRLYFRFLGEFYCAICTKKKYELLEEYFLRIIFVSGFLKACIVKRGYIDEEI